MHDASHMLFVGPLSVSAAHIMDRKLVLFVKTLSLLRVRTFSAMCATENSANVVTVASGGLVSAQTTSAFPDGSARSQSQLRSCPWTRKRPKYQHFPDSSSPTRFREHFIRLTFVDDGQNATQRRLKSLLRFLNWSRP
jgi:hypothetical protein